MHALHARVADLLAAKRDFAGHRRDPVARAFRDAFYGFCDFAGAVGGLEGTLFFDVEILCVFADDDEVDLRFRGGSRLDRPDIGVEIELFAESDDRGGVAGDFSSWGADGSEEGAVTFLLEGIDGPVGKCCPGLLESFEASGKVYKGEFEVEGARNCFEDSSACLCQSDVRVLKLYARTTLTGMTSRPIPSPGKRPIRNILAAMRKGINYKLKKIRA